jgi:phosphate transport system substrate-binding protein
MQNLLSDINRIPGISGSMICDPDGRVLAEAAPPDIGGSVLLETARALAHGTAELEVVAGNISLIELHHGKKRIVARQIAGGTLLTVCEKDANPRQLLSAVADVIERHGQKAAGPSVTQQVQAASGMGARTSNGVPKATRTSGSLPAAPSGGGGIPRRTLLIGGGIAVALFGLIAAYGILGRSGGEGGGGSAPGKPAASGKPPEIILRIGGAKTFAAQLAPNLAKGYLESGGFTDVKVEKDGEKTVVSGVNAAGFPVAIVVQGMATPKGFDGLADGSLDVAMAGRRIKPEWQAKLDAFGQMTSPGYEHVVAVSGIAVIVHPANALAKLNRDQVAGIFTGKITDWSQVGGRPGTINVHAFDEEMGLTDLFRSMVLGKAPYAPDAKIMKALPAANDAVASDPMGIGFVTLPFVKGTRAVPISEGSEPPHLPTAFTLASEDYFLTHRGYFYTVPRPERPHLLKYVQFALGADGQQVVKKSGFVELSVAAMQDEVPSYAPADYRRMVTGSRRLTSTFRFETDSAVFDTRALVDLERVTAYLVEKRLNGSAVKVLGFTDSKGKLDRNLELARERANLVREAFEQRGITGVEVAAFGPAMPVASNDTADGRQRNRRVEIWIPR